MPQGVCGKAHKISDEMIIDSNAVEKNLVLNVDLKLSDNNLPATVSIDKLQPEDAPG